MVKVSAADKPCKAKYTLTLSRPSYKRNFDSSWFLDLIFCAHGTLLMGKYREIGKNEIESTGKVEIMNE